MSDTASPPADPYEASRRLVPLWFAFACVNFVLMFRFPGAETVPFHFIWLSLALVYGLAPWRPRTMVAALAVVGVATFAALVHHAHAGYIPYEEVTEVPLMSAIFLAMVWHVRRRQVALQEVQRLAAVERGRAAARDMFVRLASHEMRTPLTVVRGYAELIRSAQRDPQTVEDAAIVLDELDKLDRTTRRLVTLIGMDTAATNVETDLDQLLERTARRWELAATRAWRVEAAAGSLAVDPERLEVAVDCLLENAVKYSDDGDAITLRGRRRDGAVEIEVADEGRGIPPDEVDAVLGVGVRGSNAGDRGGTGLGLAVVQRVVRERGGSVSVHSTLGEGTVFGLEFPVQPPDPVPVPVSRSDEAFARAGSRPAAAGVTGPGESRSPADSASRRSPSP
jgi:two-component system, OmpR family, sensor kinase